MERFDGVTAHGHGDEHACICLIGKGQRVPESATVAALGGKAWNLARLSALDLPVPPAFVLGTG